MQHRNSYSDLGLTVALSVFVCILVKCLLFGFTWVGIVWLLLACAYFYLSWHHPSGSKVVRHATTAFLALSAIAIAGVVLFDKNTRPVMHAFEGTGDTIKDAEVVEEEPIAPIYVPQPEDTVQEDTLPMEEPAAFDSLINEKINTTTNIDTTKIEQ